MDCPQIPKGWWTLSNDDLTATKIAYADAIIAMETVGGEDHGRAWKAAHRAANAAREKMVKLSRTPAEVPLVRLGQGDFTTDYTPEGEKQ